MTEFETEVLSRLTAIEAKLDIGIAVTIPTPAGGLYDFVRPAAGTPRYGLGVEMTLPDAFEAKKRAMHSVNWRGGQARADADEAAVWAEIEALKVSKADDPLLDRYRSLDPEFAGFALLTGLFDVVARDGATFGVNSAKRESYAGATIQSFLDDQFAVIGGGGGASGE